MKNSLWIISFLLANISHASTPLWSFSPITATKISIAPEATATVQYRVTNQSRKSHTLVMTQIAGVSQVTAAGNCPNPFTLTYQQSCILTLQIMGNTLQSNISGGPQVCQQGSQLQCYQPGVNDILNITRSTAPSGPAVISSSVNTLALRVSGLARKVIITNTSEFPALDVNYSTTPALPAGTTITPDTCGIISAGGTCTLTITPGATPSAAAGNTSPTPITLTIQGTNSNILIPTLNVLAYGSVYQSGFVFSFNDSTPDTVSVGGKVASLVDQSPPFDPPVPWSADAFGFFVADNVPGVTDQSMSGPGSCNGNTDGSCNTAIIVGFYPNTPLNAYASGLCKATIDGYSDWYLPAICELGYDATIQGSGCGSVNMPTIQNMKSNLFDIGIGDLGTVNYKSSTESSGDPTNQMWVQLFTNNQQLAQQKFAGFHIRCVRSLT